MKTSNKNFRNIDEYMSGFPEEVKKILGQIRQTIKKASPGATEAISYQIPTFKLNGNLVHFAAFKNHIGFYPTAKAIIIFQKELSGYKTSKGAIQFPLNRKVPLGLIAKITKFRVKENLKKTKSTYKPTINKNKGKGLDEYSIL